MKANHHCWHKPRCYYLHRPSVEAKIRNHPILKRLRLIQPPTRTIKGVSPIYPVKPLTYVHPGDYLFKI